MADSRGPVTNWLEEWAPPVYRFALRLTGDLHAAEDLAQETLLRAWHRREQLREVRAARVWLFRIAANLWQDQLRRGRSQAAQPAPLPADCVGPARTPEQGLAMREELRRALSLLDGLPSRQREVLYLSACEELSLREIGQVLSISPEAVKASLSVARKKLRQQLGLASAPPQPGEHAP